MKKNIITNAEFDKIKSIIENTPPSTFYIDWLSASRFKFSPKVSFGTLSMLHSYGAISGIHSFAEIIRNDNGKAIISTSTKIRFELYIFGLLSIILPIIFVENETENFPLWAYFLMPVTFIWFSFIYKIQEKRLFDLLRTYILGLLPT